MPRSPLDPVWIRSRTDGDSDHHFEQLRTIHAAMTATRGAWAAGAAGWCFHNGDNRFAPNQRPGRSFDLRQKRLFDQFDEVETEGVRQLAAWFAEAKGEKP